MSSLRTIHTTSRPHKYATDAEFIGLSRADLYHLPTHPHPHLGILTALHLHMYLVSPIWYLCPCIFICPQQTLRHL